MRLRSEWLTRLSSAAGTLVSRDIAVLTNAIAFNFLLCLFPLLMVVAAVSQQLPGSRRAGTALLLLLDELIPFGHEAMAPALRNLNKMAKGLEVVSLALIVWGSSGIFMPVEMALNRAWGGRPHRHFWRSRMLAVLMTLAGGLLALCSVALTLAARAALWGGGAWEIAKYLFLIQLARMNLEAFYGPLAFSVALVLWAYVSSLALVFGALMVPTAPPSKP